MFRLPRLGALETSSTQKGMKPVSISCAIFNGFTDFGRTFVQYNRSKAKPAQSAHYIL